MFSNINTFGLSMIIFQLEYHKYKVLSMATYKSLCFAIVFLQLLDVLYPGHIVMDQTAVIVFMSEGALETTVLLTRI